MDIVLVIKEAQLQVHDEEGNEVIDYQVGDYKLKLNLKQLVALGMAAYEEAKSCSV